jgi:hypothetical protein
MKKGFLLLSAAVTGNTLFARGYNRSGVDGDQLALFYLAFAAAFFLIGYFPEIKQYIMRSFFHKPNHS